MAEEAEALPKRSNVLVRVVDVFFDPVLGLLDDIGGTVMLFGKAMTWMVRPPFRPAQLAIAVEFVGAGSLFIVGLVGTFTGMAFTASTVTAFRQFGAEGMVGGVVGLALSRELAPVLAGVVVTARAGSTMASELGNMRVTEQIDAITTMGVSPIQYLVVPRVVATVITLPMLAFAFGMFGMGGAYIVAVYLEGIDPGVFMDKVHNFVTWADIRELLIKSIAFAIIISTICCKKGFHASGGARGVGEATAKAVVASIVAVFAANYIATTILTDM